MAYYNVIQLTREPAGAVERLSGWLPQTMYIGDILKAHC